MAFEATNPWRLPDAFEIRDALESVKMMGGTVARIYTITVRRQDDLPDTPRYVLGPKQFNEEAFQTLDQILAIANEVGVRLIIPFVDNWRWMGGRAEYAAFRNKSANEFGTTKRSRLILKKPSSLSSSVSTRSTGIAYRDDKAILAWETGNELQCPDDWTREMIAYIKELDTNHLVIDGYHTSVLRDESLANPKTDIVTTHHYERDPARCWRTCVKAPKKPKGKSLISSVNSVFSAPRRWRRFMILSKRRRAFAARCFGVCGFGRATAASIGIPNRGGRLFLQSLSYARFGSGDLYDERNAMALLREHAYGIRGLARHPCPRPNLRYFCRSMRCLS